MMVRVIRKWIAATERRQHAVARLLLLAACLLAVVDGSLLAQTIDAEIVNPGVAGGLFSFDIRITPTSDWGAGSGERALGDCSWAFALNTAALASPTLTQIGVPVNPDSGYSSSVTIAGDRLVVTTEYDGVGSGVSLTQSTAYLLYRVEMTITNAAAMSQVEWDTLDTGVFNRPDAIVSASYAGSGDQTLPVQLSAFSVGATGDGAAELRWSTASEIDNLGFEIYRSADAAGPFRLVGSWLNDPALAGAGNSNQRHDYRWVDRTPAESPSRWYRLASVDASGQREFFGPLEFHGETVLPTAFALDGAYPNPFNPETTIRLTVPDGAAARQRVTVTIFNLLGQPVRQMAAERMEPGEHHLVWDGRDDRGNTLASGVYYLRMVAGNYGRTIALHRVR